MIYKIILLIFCILNVGTCDSPVHELLKFFHENREYKLWPTAINERYSFYLPDSDSEIYKLIEGEENIELSQCWFEARHPNLKHLQFEYHFSASSNLLFYSSVVKQGLSVIYAHEESNGNILTYNIDPPEGYSFQTAQVKSSGNLVDILNITSHSGNLLFLEEVLEYRNKFFYPASNLVFNSQLGKLQNILPSKQPMRGLTNP